MENLYQVWLKARHPKTLQPVATMLVFSHEDRLRAEGIVEAAQQSNAFRDVADVFRIWHPGCLIDVEMTYPGLYSVPRRPSSHRSGGNGGPRRAEFRQELAAPYGGEHKRGIITDPDDLRKAGVL